MARSGQQRNVRVYTVNNESRYVVVRNIPAINVIDDAIKRLSLYGDIEEHRVLLPPPSLRADEDEEHHSDFTETLFVKYETVNNARHAKNRVQHKPVFGSVLEVSYAPQYESAQDTANKLRERRELIERRAAPRPPRSVRQATDVASTSGESLAVVRQEDNAAFIGPRLPVPGQQQVTTAAVAMVPRAVVDQSKRRRI